MGDSSNLRALVPQLTFAAIPQRWPRVPIIWCRVCLALGVCGGSGLVYAGVRHPDFLEHDCVLTLLMPLPVCQSNGFCWLPYRHFANVQEQFW